MPRSKPPRAKRLRPRRIDDGDRRFILMLQDMVRMTDRTERDIRRLAAEAPAWEVADALTRLARARREFLDTQEMLLKPLRQSALHEARREDDW